MRAENFMADRFKSVSSNRFGQKEDALIIYAPVGAILRDSDFRHGQALAP